MSSKRPVITFLGEAMVELTSTSGTTLDWTFAGDVLNAAAACAATSTSTDVRLVTGVGDDDLSDQLLRRSLDLGVDASNSVRIADRTLGLYWITEVDGERRFRYWRSQSACRAALESGRFVPTATGGSHLAWSGITLAVAGDGRVALLDAIESARNDGVTVCFDVNHRTALWPDTTSAQRSIDAALARADLVVASTDDLRALWDEDGSAFTERLLAAGAGEVIVTDGVGPVTCSSPATSFVVQPVPATIVDTAGAGDALWGTYLGRRCEGSGPESALSTAIDVARRAVEHPGALGYIER